MENSVYLVDYENVSYKGLYGIGEINPKDEVVIFHSDDISIIKDILSIYNKSDILINYFELNNTGKNALDFMITTYAGYAASKDNINKIVILSNDKGFSSITNVIAKLNPKIDLVFENCIYNANHPENIKCISSSEQSSEKTNTFPIEDGQERSKLNTYMQHELRALGYPANIINNVCKIVILHCKEERMLNSIHNDLKTIDFSDHQKLYQDVKSLLNNYKNNIQICNNTNEIPSLISSNPQEERWNKIESELNKTLSNEIQNLHLYGLIQTVKRYYENKNSMKLIEAEIRSNYDNSDYICSKINDVLNSIKANI